MTPAMATVLAPFFAFMRRCQIYPKITHIPGHLNDIADALSRFKQPLPEPLTLSNQCQVRWQTLLDSASIFTAQSGQRWRHRFGIGEKWFLQSPLTQGSSIDRLWVFLLRLVDFRSKLVFGTPHFTHFIFTTPLFGYVYLSCLGVPVICTILYLGGPAGTMHDCTNLQI